MVGWYYWLDGHEFEQALGVGDGQGRLLCCHPWGSKELDMTEQLNWLTDSASALSVTCMLLFLFLCFSSVQFSFLHLVHAILITTLGIPESPTWSHGGFQKTAVTPREYAQHWVWCLTCKHFLHKCLWRQFSNVNMHQNIQGLVTIQTSGCHPTQ